jgi:predicted O-methyltransferase YrrM
MKRWQDVPGRLLDEEGEVLRELAADGMVLEIGSLLGRSTVCMAQVARHVHAVDPHPPGNTNFDEEFRGLDSLTELRKNLRTMQVENRVSLHICTVAELWIPAIPQFDLVFIDGSHHRDAVLLDLEYASATLRTGGKVACHDHSTGHPGVMEAVKQFGKPVLRQVRGLAVM